jgi:hypothetical protein
MRYGGELPSGEQLALDALASRNDQLVSVRLGRIFLVSTKEFLQQQPPLDLYAPGDR